MAVILPLVRAKKPPHVQRTYLRVLGTRLGPQGPQIAGDARSARVLDPPVDVSDAH
jgi:hypothetical protein